LEFKTGVDDLISEVVFVDFFLIFVENCEVVEVGMSIEIEGYFIKTDLKLGSRREFSQLLLIHFDLVYLIFGVKFRLEDLFSIKISP